MHRRGNYSSHCVCVCVCVTSYTLLKNAYTNGHTNWLYAKIDFQLTDFSETISFKSFSVALGFYSLLVLYPDPTLQQRRVSSVH